MDSLHKPLTEVFKAAPLETIPKASVAAYLLLIELCDGEQHDRNELANKTGLGETLRSALQYLRGAVGGYWLIHSVPIKGLDKTYLQLDSKHLSGDPKQDLQARIARRKELGKVSHKQATQGRVREPEAFREMTEANKAYYQSLGDAANDSNIDG